MIARATKIADDSRAEILAGAKEQAEKATSRAREEITAEKERAMAELRATVADLALDAAGKLVRSEMDAKTQRRLVEEFLAEVTTGDDRKGSTN
jgi:F-type H+-transporting ATPase subunit b